MMIAISPSQFFLLHVGLMLAVLGAFWVRTLWRGRAQGWDLSEERLVRCGNCGRVFVGKRVETIGRCPECQQLTRIPAKKKSRIFKY